MSSCCGCCFSPGCRLLILLCITPGIQVARRSGFAFGVGRFSFFVAETKNWRRLSSSRCTRLARSSTSRECRNSSSVLYIHIYIYIFIFARKQYHGRGVLREVFLFHIIHIWVVAFLLINTILFIDVKVC